ncbi:hypothetical protein [Streptomyces qinzhouensis]|uniref:Lipoprotein n=1 Tax=Streptomyces qinzhouensis TaxID=2599401 RepID=A0A5B8J394_9ACTN|nr:hypothetical protein [Streptomyces qinzhouensis]QDY76225.1 hypothetical protein FQU76_06420 [Streptomyces qinzhouensis]
MRSLTRRGRAAGVPAALALALALALAGCGSDGGGAKVASAPSAEGTAGSAKDDGSSGGGPVPEDDRDKARKFAECLREHGLKVADPEDGKFTMDGNGLPKDKLKKATEACRAFQPQGKAKGKPDAKMVEAMRTFAECMRTNGVEKFPDPGSGGGIQIDGSIAGDPDFKAAEKKCQAGMPKGPGKKNLDG